MHEALRQLVLIPTSPDWLAPSQPEFARQLGELGLLGPALPGGAQRFAVGEHFLQQFSFMGCAPNLDFATGEEPPASQAERVFICVHAAPSIQWYGDALLGKPACPQCHKRNSAWPARFDAASRLLRCAHCERASAVCDWQWFDAGGCARQFIAIVNVYPKESIPTDALLQELAVLTGVSWTYFYLHAPLLAA